MRLTVHDLPIGVARCAPMTLRDAAEPTIVEIARLFDIHPNAVTNFRRRHPECREWSVEKICRQVADNKNQREVARRQGLILQPGRRPKFRSMCRYE